jgi:hypothetical protein
MISSLPFMQKVHTQITDSKRKDLLKVLSNEMDLAESGFSRLAENVKNSAHPYSVSSPPRTFVGYLEPNSRQLCLQPFFPLLAVVCKRHSEQFGTGSQ